MATPAGGTASLYESGASNTDILDSIGSEVLAEHTPAAIPAADTGVDAGATPVLSPTGETVPAAGEQPVRPDWFESAPAEYKNLSAHANLSKTDKDWLEKTYGELNTLKASPIATPESLTELTEMFPGGIEDIREAGTQAQQYRTEMEQFRSGDPDKQTELLGGLIQDNPDSYVTLMHSAAALLKQTLRDDYTAFATDMAKDHLDTITDGKFSSFFDNVTNLAQQYNQLLDTNPEQAQKIAAKLGGAALQMADWWGSAKNKLGYGEKVAGAPQTNRAAVVNRQPDDREIALAQKESNLWSSNYFIKHDQMVNPMISRLLSTELVTRKMDKMPQAWQQRIMQSVADGIKSNLSSDKTFSALENRTYRRNAPTDPRKWDNSDTSARILLNAVKQRAEKLVPTLLKRALDEVQTIYNGGQQKPGQAGAGNRGGQPPPVGTGTGNWEQDLKDGKITSAEAIQRMAGIA